MRSAQEHAEMVTVVHAESEIQWAVKEQSIVLIMLHLGSLPPRLYRSSGSIGAVAGRLR